MRTSFPDRTLLLATFLVGMPCLASNELTVVTPDDGVDNDNFGDTVSMDGDLLVAGAPFADIDGVETQGAAYLYRENPLGTYDLVTKLTASDGVEFDQLGTCVGISGDTIVVGAKGAPVGGNSSQGAAYLYRQNPADPDDWPQLLRLEAATSIGNIAEYGTACAIDGDTIVVGAQKAGSGGQAFVYYRDFGGSENWGEVSVVQDDISDSNASFGYSVALHGDTLAVGATSLDEVAFTFENEGGVYVFDRNEGGADNWGQVDKLFASDADGGSFFGAAVDIDGDVLAVGAWAHDGAVNFSEGQAYVFEQVLGEWVEQRVLAETSPGAFRYFGRSVAIVGDTLFVGATGFASERGRIYRFEKDAGGAGNWGETDQLSASTPQADDILGRAMALGPGLLAAGAPGPATSGAGEVLIFEAPAAAVDDTDGDGVDDSQDNCTLVPNADQRDTNEDGFGNVCDGDLDDNGVVDFADLAILKERFFGGDPDADLDGDGIVAFPDLALMKENFFGPPGPGADDS